MARLMVLILLLIPVTGFSTGQQLEWKKVKDKDGVQVYRAHSDDSQFKTFKSVSRIELDNIQSFVGLLLDEQAYPRWVHMVSSAELKATDDPRRYELFIETRLPWPVRNRFTKVDLVLTQKEDYSIRFELREPLIPAQPRDGFILAFTRGFYELKINSGSNNVDIIAEVFADPGGFVPAFLVNIITVDMSYYTAKKLERIIKTEKYQNYSTNLVKRRPWVVAE